MIRDWTNEVFRS